VPVKPGDRVKTDRRDALKLARNYRAGKLTAAWVPDASHEALRDLVRAREAAKKDELRQNVLTGLLTRRSSNECIGHFESAGEAFCCPDFRVTTWALCIDPPLPN
jgi:transposase